ncbi:Transcriptional regulator of competence genes, TfoX/Sxy family [Variovorax sp. YR752]|uniref:TfoX/Sxy family protein n=1 Tax=Variovorax sp. YR752 TaxID=1884383 RepID=UPI000BDCCE67|nr:TfoX/Sxy family protein [Variovorax sp. YR752]SOD29134.1 Transcriptional regulator of competence genes, TfoX/Sxy family [Variovorax sp. YR752]
MSRAKGATAAPTKSEPSRERALELAESLHAMGPIEVKRFFGGFGLVMQGVQFAFVMKSTLYLRVDDTTRPEFERIGATPFAYATRVSNVKVASYYQAPVDAMDDPHVLREWAVKAYASAVGAQRPKPAAPRKRRPAQTPT